MKKRIFSALLVFALLGGSVCAHAADFVQRAPYASRYLDGYGISVNPKGDGLMSVTYIIYGTGTMDCIGAKKILIEEWDGSDWVKTGSLSVEKNPEFYAYKASEHAGSITFYGIPGVQYRATLTAYAERDGGSDTKTFICTPKTCE